MKSVKAKVGIGLAVVLLCAAMFALPALLGCNGEECLVEGENCTQSYKLSEYGTTDIWCCEPMICKDNVSARVCKY